MTPRPAGAPRCPECCDHGILLVRPCGWCEPHDPADPYEGPGPDEPQWLCPHGIGREPQGSAS